MNSPDCDFLYWIEEVVVFGSILTNKSRLSDIDISIRLAKKLEAKEFSVAAERRTRLAAANGRSFRNIVDEVYWPEREVLLFVKSRSRAISLIEWNSKWLQEQDHRVLYRRTDDSKMTMSADDQIEHCDGASKPALKA